MFKITLSAVLMSLVLVSSSTYAEQAKHKHNFRSESLFDFGDKERWIIGARILLVEPDESATISAIGGSADVDEQFVPELDFTYFLTHNVALEIILATTPHNVTATNTAVGQVDLGSVWLLPPTLTMQYHFMPENKGFRPYLGAGINYTHFFNEDKGAVNSIDYDNSFGYALQAGFDYGINEHWAINLDVKKIMLNTDVRIQSGATRINADIDIDPWIFGVGLSYRF
jgi:outer membrane protein